MRRFVGSIVVLGVLASSATAVAAPSDRYAVRNILSSSPLVPADRYDPNLVNPWGLVSSPTSPWWPANNGTNTSTIVPATGAINTTVVAVPGGPTGIVWNGTAGAFPIPGGQSNFIFNTEAGEIYGWRTGANSVLGISRTSAGAAYMGMAIATVNGSPRLYSTDFHNARIDVVNAQWQLVELPPGAFVDPNLPADYAPYGIQTIPGNRIVVTYAKQDAAKLREVPGAGLGAVSIFDLNGTFLARVATGGPLNAPWGTALANPNFGAYGGDLLIGNFGDGRILAYRENPNGTWTQGGVLKSLDGSIMSIGGLWAIQFGSGAANNGARNHLYFTAGPFGEFQGLMGRIMPNPSEAGGTVPATLALSLGGVGGPASFGAFTPGLAKDYAASTSATVTHSAGDALLTVADPSSTATGRLVNGTFALTSPLMTNATSPGATGGALAAVGGSAAPTTLLTYTGPMSNDPVTVNFQQSIGANEPLRTGTYTKTLTFTLSTTTP